MPRPINYAPSDRQLYGREGAENIQLHKMLKAQRAVIQKYEMRMEEAEKLLDEAARAGNATPGGWVQLQLKIVKFLSPETPLENPNA